MKRGLASTTPQMQPGLYAISPTQTQIDGQTSSHTDTNSPHRIWKTNYIKSCHLVSSSEWLNLSFPLSDFLYYWLSQLCQWQTCYFILLFWHFYLSSPSAIEKEAHRERHRHHNLSGAGSIAFHPSEYSLTLPARLCYRPRAQPMLWKHLLQVNAQNRISI